MVRDLGDGSVSVDFCQSEEEANQKEKQEEEEGYNFAESSVHHIDLYLDEEGEELTFSDYREINGKYQNVKLKLEEENCV